MQRGFVRKRGTNTTWTTYYYVTLNGKRQQRSKAGFKTKKAATAYLTEILAALQRQDLVEPSKLTVGEYLLEHWMPIQRHAVRPSTWDNYRRMLTIHLIPKLGHLPLQDLTAGDLDQLYAALLSHGHCRRPGGLAPKSVRNLHNTIQKALKDAERKGLVQRNVAVAADAPKLRQSGSADQQTWSADEVKDFLDALADHRLYAGYVLSATTGMRRGEVLGLRWRDIDFTRSRLAVRQTVVSVDYQILLSTPKTARGRRSIALDATTLAALKAHRKTQQQERQLIGSAYQDHDLVFAKPDGTTVHPDYYSQTFDRTVARLGMRRICLHGLRHTYATLGLQAGVPPKVMSDRLGHATVAFTQDRYMHAIPALEEQAADQVADLIFGRETA